MKKSDFLKELKALGNETTKQIYENHGATGTIYGVKIGDIKELLSKHKLKMDHTLAWELMTSDVKEAKYASKFLFDYKQLTKVDLERMLLECDWYLNVETAVPDIAAQSDVGFELARVWVLAEDSKHLAAGFSLYSTLLSFYPNDFFSQDELEDLLKRVEDTIHAQENRVRYAMNGFVIALGAYFPLLTMKAKESAKNIGKVDVYFGKTACKVPDALPYIEKIEKKDRLGKKRKTIC